MHAAITANRNGGIGCGPDGCSCGGTCGGNGAGCGGQGGNGRTGLGGGAINWSGAPAVIRKHPQLTAAIAAFAVPPPPGQKYPTYWGGPRKTLHENMPMPAGWVNPWQDVDVTFSGLGDGKTDLAKTVIQAAGNAYSASQNAKAAKAAAGPQTAGWITNLNALVSTVGNAAAVIQGYKNGTLTYGQTSTLLQQQGVPPSQIPQVLNAGGSDLSSQSNQRLLLYGGLAIAAILLLKK